MSLISTNDANSAWDCIVVGGGAAGLSAALVLGRARRHTLVIDAGMQSNRPAEGIGGLLGHDRRPPGELYRLGRAELEAYPSVEVREGVVTAGERIEDGAFRLELADGQAEHARRVLLATGMDYRPPSIPGLDELWGRSVFHCPFCHGWEVRDQPLAALADGERGLHAGLLLRGWSDDVVLLTDGPSSLGASDLERLAAGGVTVDQRRVAELVAEDGELAAIAFADGSRLARRGLLVPATLHQRSDLAVRLGAELAPSTALAHDPVQTDDMLRASLPGVFAAGDVTAHFPQVAGAIAAGSMAAAIIVQSLLAEDVGLPVPGTKD
jgi:thioredoxin reductase